jgi:uncharacterized Ntn-hydrolase superfamily protein
MKDIVEHLPADARPGTFSIAAYDPASETFGTAVATGIVAVGATCPYVSADAAVLTQSFTRTEHGRDLLDRVADGDPIDEAGEALLAADDHAGYRQVHGVDSSGTFTFTGDDCVSWCGHRAGEHVTVAGNMLVGERVVDSVFEAFADTDPEDPLGDRLLAALNAGDEAGGDKRGEVSAALLVHAPEPSLAHNLRVDRADDPVGELRALYDHARSVEAGLEEATDELVGEDYPEELLRTGIKY